MKTAYFTLVVTLMIITTDFYAQTQDDLAELLFSVDLNDEEKYQPIHIEACDKSAFAIVAKFEGRKPLFGHLGLGKYKLRKASFKLINAYHFEDKKFKIIDVKRTTANPCNLVADVHFEITLTEIKNGEASKAELYTPKNRRHSRFEKDVVVGYYLKFEDEFHDYICTKKIKKENYKNLDDYCSQLIGDHICNSKYTY